MAFFQLERSSEVFDKASQGMETEIPVIFRLKEKCIDCENAKTICQALRKKPSKCEECQTPKCENCENGLVKNAKPQIPLKSKVLLEGQ